MFDGLPTYPRYRTLGLTTPLQSGEDVYALQTALQVVNGQTLILDGVLGRKTSAAIKECQRRLVITQDSRAGGRTQQAIVKALCANRSGTALPIGLAYGQCMHESGCRLGNYSPPRPDGNFDAGVTQRNTQFTPAREGFDVPASIARLIKNTREYYDKYAGIRSTKRRWKLAAGAWNAPAFANYLARSEGAKNVRLAETAKPSPAQIETLEAYMTSVSAYMKL